MSNYPAGVTNSMIERQCLDDDEIQCRECGRIANVHDAQAWNDYEGVGTLCVPCGAAYEEHVSQPEDGI